MDVAVVLSTWEPAAVVTANDAALLMFGDSVTRIRGRPPRALHPASASEALQRFSHGLRTRGHASNKRLPCLRADGTRFWAHVQASRVTVAGHELTVASYRDTSSEVEVERALQARIGDLAQQSRSHAAHAARLQMLVDSAQDAVFLSVFENARIIHPNPAAIALFGYSAEEFAQMTGRQLSAPESDPIIDGFNESLNTIGRAWNPRVCMVRKDGSTFWGNLRVNAFEVDGVRYTGTVVRDVSIEVNQELELRESYARLQAAESRLVESARLSVMGQLGAGMAHELNQPLTAIRGFAERILRAPDAPVDRFRSELDIIRGETVRMGRIIDSVRTFARPDAAHSPSHMDPRQPLDDALLLCQNQFQQRGIQLSIESEPVDRPVIADRVRLHQVFLNLFTNASDAIAEAPGEGGEICCRIWVDGDQLCYRVEDSGVGLPAEADHRVFEPFFTTKPPGRGTGLGLSIVYGIVRDHGGSVDTGPSPLGGARFELRLPLGPRGTAAPL